MTRIYFFIGLLQIILLFIICIVTLAKNRFGIFLSSRFGLSILGFIALELATIICIYSVFFIAGGPDGKTISIENLLAGGLLLVTTVFFSSISLHLLSLPLLLATPLLTPAILAIIGKTCSTFEIIMASFLLPPFYFLAIITLWSRGELKE